MKKKKVVRVSKNKPEKISRVKLIEMFSAISESSAEWAKKLKAFENDMGIDADDVRLESFGLGGTDVTDEVIPRLAEAQFLLDDISLAFGLKFNRDTPKSK